ncbi:sulfotransferase domain-containing protein [Winogradskyella undariae]|uniref:sulfotransferase domain-containing protein n=1 Tax=Winogradskyella TaxID=286104 RepID=UPI00156AD59F|nr:MULTISPECIES: sulfotransferase domain-containing protein [Winogradskyella]NRR91031.1 sulfotransferase domain-containing protein [Winogradskyella undariae]QXP80022.1 sulfotransferase domain-containing protein [Winogradskyella sp. HaHa_3_26]
MSKTKKLLKIVNYLGFYIYKYPFLIKRKFSKASQNIIIFASPRGGSTFLMEFIARNQDSTIIYEPLYPNFFKELKVLKFEWNNYIEEKTKDNKAFLFFENLFNQRIISFKPYSVNNYWQSLRSKINVFKIIRGNLMLPYLVNNFELKPIFFVRSPYATVASQLNHPGWAWVLKDCKYHLPRDKSTKAYVLKFGEALKKVNAPHTRLAFEWALNHQLCLNHKNNNVKWLTVSYENLIINTNFEINRLSDWLDITFKNKNIKQASRTTIGDSKKTILSGNQLNNWRKHLNSKEIDEIREILNLCDIYAFDDENETNIDLLYKNGV